jgi:threonine synthase
MNIKISEKSEVEIRSKALTKSLYLLEQVDGMSLEDTRSKMLNAYTNLILEYESLLILRDEVDNYTKGQEDLIQYIKDEVFKMEETTNIVDFPFDILYLLKSIKPKQR